VSGDEGLERLQKNWDELVPMLFGRLSLFVGEIWRSFCGRSVGSTFPVSGTLQGSLIFANLVVLRVFLR
jgi:hypothetical protein